MTDALRLTVWFGERDRVGRELLGDALLDLFAAERVRASALLRGIEGFGVKHRLQTERIEALSYDLPLVATALDAPARVEALLPGVTALVGDGLVTVERAQLAGAGAEPRLYGETKLSVHVGRGERAAGQPAYRGVVELLHRHGLHGATVLLGLDGTVDGVRRRARFLSRNAGVPLVVVSVGSADAVARALPELRRLLPEPLLAVERAHVLKRDGRTLAEPPALAAADATGLGIWQKLTLYTSEDARSGRDSVYVRLVAALRRHRLSGATALRGIWGFSGEREPHGESLRALRRRVPVVVTCVDTPGRIRTAWRIVDELTAEGGLVTSEAVPAFRAAAGGVLRGGLRPARVP